MSGAAVVRQWAPAGLDGSGGAGAGGRPRTRLRAPVAALRAAGVPWREVALLAAQTPEARGPLVAMRMHAVVQRGQGGEGRRKRATRDACAPLRARVEWPPAVLSVPARGPLSVSAAPQALAADAQPALAAALRALLALGLSPADASRTLRRFPRALRLAPGRLAGAAGRLERLGVPPGAVPGVLRAAPGVLDAAEPRLATALAGLQARWAHACVTAGVGSWPDFSGGCLDAGYPCGQRTQCAFSDDIFINICK